MIPCFKDFLLERYSLVSVPVSSKSDWNKAGYELTKSGYDYLGTIVMEQSGNQSRDEKIMAVVPERIIRTLIAENVPSVVNVTDTDKLSIYSVLVDQEQEEVESFDDGDRYMYLLKNNNSNYYYYLSHDKESTEFATWFIYTRMNGKDMVLREFEKDYGERFIRPAVLKINDYAEICGKYNTYRYLGMVWFNKDGHLENDFVPDDFMKEYESVKDFPHQVSVEYKGNNYKLLSDELNDPRNVEKVYKCRTSWGKQEIYYVLVNEPGKYFYVLKDNPEYKRMIKLAINLRVQGRNKVERKMIRMFK